MLLVMAVGFGGMAAMVPYYGVVFVPVLVSGMYFLALTVEGEINKRIPSDRRATVLSLKNMALNLAFAAGMPLFAEAAARGLAVGFRSLFLFFVASSLVLLLASRGLRAGGETDVHPEGPA
jgi:hypothetical protein